MGWPNSAFARHIEVLFGCAASNKVTGSGALWQTWGTQFEQDGIYAVFPRRADMQVGEIYLTCASTIAQKFDAANETARRLVPSPMWGPPCRAWSIPLRKMAPCPICIRPVCSCRELLCRRLRKAAHPHLLPHRPWSQRAHRWQLLRSRREDDDGTGRAREARARRHRCRQQRLQRFPQFVGDLLSSHATNNAHGPSCDDWVLLATLSNRVAGLPRPRFSAFKPLDAERDSIFWMSLNASSSSGLVCTRRPPQQFVAAACCSGLRKLVI